MASALKFKILSRQFHTSSALYACHKFNICSNPSTKNLPRKSVCVVGGGFGGLYTALRLEKLTTDTNGESNFDITVIDKKDKFVFLPLLYELTIGTASASEVAPFYKDLLRHSQVKFTQGTVSNIDFKSNCVKFFTGVKDSSEQLMNYDYLVLSPGAQPRVDNIPGAREHAIPFYLAENAMKLRQKLQAIMKTNKQNIRVVVVGGGYSGVEIATNVAEYLGSRGVISLVDRGSKILASSPKHNRDTAERCLSAAGVSVLSEKCVEGIHEDRITLSEKKDGQIIYEFNVPADVVILTSGMEPNTLVSKLDLPKSEFGKILTNRNLKIIGLENVYASGDCAQIEGNLLPSTAQVAMQQADVVAKNIALEANSVDSKAHNLHSFNYMPLGEMLTLGFKEASITGLGGLLQLDGPVAALLRRLTYAIRMPTRSQRVTALIHAGLSTLEKLASRFGPEIKTR